MIDSLVAGRVPISPEEKSHEAIYYDPNLTTQQKLNLLKERDIIGPSDENLRKLIDNLASGKGPMSFPSKSIYEIYYDKLLSPAEKLQILTERSQKPTYDPNLKNMINILLREVVK
jgi:hypothetical protein